MIFSVPGKILAPGDDIQATEDKCVYTAYPEEELKLQENISRWLIIVLVIFFFLKVAADSSEHTR